MKLGEAVERLKAFDDEHTIYAAEPWTEASEAVVALEPLSGGLPAEAAEAGLKYFLEVSIALEVIEDWIDAGQQPDARAICQRVIQYAINDA